MEGYKQREEIKINKIKWAIWHLGALIRSNKYPTYEEFMKTEKSKKSKEKNKRMTNEEMYKRVEELNKIFGGSINSINKVGGEN